MTRRLLWTAASLFILVAFVAGAIFAGLFEKSVVAEDVAQPLTSNQMATLAKRGAYIAVAADCYACHTTKGGAPWAGGLPVATPFGTIYSTNISSDKENGIGNWTRADFHRAVRDGIGPNGHLYPAMPYVSYRKMTPQDVDALYAYFMTRAPMKVANRKNELVFPFNIRQAMTFWNLLNLPDEATTEDSSRSIVWNRGRHLVDALAHCGECHTPRNITQGLKEDAYLRGTVLEGVTAPDITREGLERMGFTPQVLAAFMKSGISALGAMTNQMFDVVHFSTQYMTPDDLDALSAYLFDLDEMSREAATPTTSAPVAIPPELAASALPTYLALCSGCHGVDGQGIPHVVVPLTTNASLKLASPRNLIHTILEGIPAQRFPGLERMQPMPGFKDELNDQQLAALVNWLRMNWGGTASKVDAEHVLRLRQRD